MKTITIYLFLITLSFSPSFAKTSKARKKKVNVAKIKKMSKDKRALLCYQCCVGEKFVTQKICSKYGLKDYKKRKNCGC